MPPGGAPLRMKMSCRGATCGRPSAVAVDIVASVIPERAGTGPAPTVPWKYYFHERHQDTKHIEELVAVRSDRLE